jgi:hypothetical protein
VDVEKVFHCDMIYYIGDSHTAGIGHMNPIKEIYEYNPYPYYLSNLLNSEYINLGIPGSNLVNNIQIFIDNLQNIINNGKMVFFQFQFFQNAYLRFDENDIGWKDIAVHKNDVIDTINIPLEDRVAILTYFEKYEERRSWYEMKKVYSLFNFLETYGIKCYALYWTPPFIINIIDDKRNIKFNDKNFVNPLNLPTLAKETNGVWDDNHIGNNSNIIVAQHIYDFLSINNP